MFFFMLQYLLRVSGVADCVWQASARAWIDSNGDGRLNTGELPLRGVQVHVDDIDNQLMEVNWPVTTDQDGQVQFSVSIPGCSGTLFEIYVDIPAGYRLTTRPRIEVRPDVWGSPGTERVYYFGFKALR